jgi:chorismate dehydratase
MTLTIGHISYINCAPFFHYLQQSGFDGRIVGGVPSELNRRLACGDLDLSPSSSFEYALNWRKYLLLPGQSISARGPVRSVLLFSRRPLEELEGEPIALTGESATSVNLLQILLREFYGHGAVNCRVPAVPVEEVIAEGGAALLIGDRALRAAASADSTLRVYDLGELWHRHTGLPFVFALWILRRDAAGRDPRGVRSLLNQLGASRKRALADLGALAATTPERSWMGEGELIDYWRAMSYDLDASHIEGLRLFFALAVKYGLLAEIPEIHFFE